MCVEEAKPVRDSTGKKHYFASQPAGFVQNLQRNQMPVTVDGARPSFPAWPAKNIFARRHAGIGNPMPLIP
jgi:hypothetical protein